LGSIEQADGFGRAARHRVHDIVRAAIACAMTLPLGQAARADTATPCDVTDATQVRLQIEVSGMRVAKGNITITIYPDDPAHFLDGKYKLDRQQLPVTLPVTSACFSVAAPGHYAVALFHDENDNHHLDTNALGIPTEGYGFSNNPTLYFGPPDLSRVRFSVHAGDNPVAIQMKYY
jgi:uncharacterized protein (DUF2141 family)